MTATTSRHISTTQPDDWGDFVSASPTPVLQPSHPSPNKSLPIIQPPHSRCPSASSSQTSNSPQNELNSSIPSLPPYPPNFEQSHHIEDQDSQAFEHTPNPSQPLQGFDNLDPVQRYAIGALAVVLLNHHASDLNGAAFARTQAAGILHALQLSSGQQTALLSLEPTSPTRDDVVSQCVQLVGDDDARFLALQAMLALSVVGGRYDSRSRAFLSSVASEFGISWRAVAAVELAVAIQIFDNAAQEEEQKQRDNQKLHFEDDTGRPDSKDKLPKSVDELLIERRKKKMRMRKAMKISGITLVGGMLFGLTGGLIAPALLSALAGVGVASAAGLAASGTVASGAVVGGLFGVAGAGFTVKKARNRISTSLEEFDFERPDDLRVIESRKRKEERQRRKLEKLVAERLAEEAAANIEVKKIEDVHREDDALPSVEISAFDTEKELPHPPSDSDEDEEDGPKKKHKRFGTWRKKQPKQKVGVRGLEAASEIPSLHVCICVPAWLTERSYGAALDQFEPGLKALLPCSQHIALRWESRRLYEMGLAFAKFWASKATVTTIQQAYPHAVAAASTVAGAVAFAFAIPLTVMSCMDYIDNPWSILVSRSNGAGEELADVLVERSYGHRPVSLFGYSIGARVIFKCLESLASRGALGIIDNVYVMGAAITADPERWKKIRPVVAGRIVNAYGSYDWALAFFHRGCGHGVYVSGLRRIELDGVENLNMAYLGVEGHRELKDCVPRVMRAMGLGVGYIVMPPARLVHKKRRSKSQQRAEGVLVSEDPVEGENSSDCLSAVPAETGDRVEHLTKIQNDKSWNTGKLDITKGGQTFGDFDEVALPPSIESEQPADRSQDSHESIAEPAEHEDTTEKSEKKKKSKSWLSWSTWSGRSGKTKKSQAVQKSDVQVQSTASQFDEHCSPPAHETQGDSDYIPIVDGVVADDAKGRNWENRGETHHLGGSEVTMVGLDVEDEELEEPEPFDWEKQRRIWEEQERQMEERGFADSAEEIEMRSKVVLNIGIEVAGRRLVRFICQDENLPVARKEEIYTNCVEDQRGVLVRIYEHEKRTKTVPVNMLKADEQYPKLLGELELLLRNAAEKGKLRAAVALECDEEGNMHASIEERFPDGSSGDRVEVSISRADLCTMAERRRLEVAERKRLEAQIQKEMRNRSSQSVPALPAPENYHGNDEKRVFDTTHQSAFRAQRNTKEPDKGLLQGR